MISKVRDWMIVGYLGLSFLIALIFGGIYAFEYRKIKKEDINL